MFQSTLIATPIVNFDLQSLELTTFPEFQEILIKYNILLEENQQLKKLIEQMEPVKFQLMKKTEPSKPTKPKNRRTSENLDKKFKCPYHNCWKEYASDLAVNLHIKNKHNGGTKTVRQSMAKKVVLAEEQGNDTPKTGINFPPGYLKDFKKKFFNDLQ